MQRYFAKLETVDDVGEVIHMACEIISDQGVVRQSYHITPAFETPTSQSTQIHARGFPEEWISLYESKLRDIDPIPARVMSHGTMMTWDECIASGVNTESDREYFIAMRKHGLIHGFGVPLFGQKACDAYSSFDFGKPLEEVNETNIGIVRAVAQAAHQRVCVLLNSSKQDYDLSDRELEVLEWLARGKSVWSIATILDIAPDTVKTYCKRIYTKLGVSDRIGAVVKALKLGLVKV